MWRGRSRPDRWAEGEPLPGVLKDPAHATVASLVGYENVVPARIDRDGLALVAGRPCGLHSDRRPGDVTVAAWATAVRLASPGGGALEATVEQVSAGPGRWELLLAGDQPLRAHLPLGEPPPLPGERRAVSLDADLATLIGAPSGPARPRPPRRHGRPPARRPAR
jgi:hypothetical protein